MQEISRALTSGFLLYTVSVTCVTVPVSYQVQIYSGTIQRRHVDQLRYRYSLDDNDRESNNFDFWPFTCTIPTTDVPSNLERGHGQLEVALSTTSSLWCSNRTRKAVDCYGFNL